MISNSAGAVNGPLLLHNTVALGLRLSPSSGVLVRIPGIVAVAI